MTQLVQFPLSIHYNMVVTARIIASSSELFLESLGKDRLGNPKWVDLTMPSITFHDNDNWKDVWRRLAKKTEYGSFLDTRTNVLPESYRGVLHGYSSRNDHAPDDQEQDAYVEAPIWDVNFNRVKGLVKADSWSTPKILLGALCVLAMARE